MKTNQLSIPILALFLVSCASIMPGNDPVVVNAERVTQLAYDTFNSIEKAEVDGYAVFKANSPDAAIAFRKFMNNIRKNQYDWLTTARTLTKVYKSNKNTQNEANLNTALAVLTSATSEATSYLSRIQEAQNLTATHHKKGT